MDRSTLSERLRDVLIEQKKQVMDLFVLRHPGTSSGRWSVRTFAQPDAARAYYDKVARALRQGTVVLWHRGAPVAVASGPRLRSRW